MLTRRELLGTVGSGLLAGIAGCGVLGNDPKFDFSGDVRTDEPLLSDTTMSLERPHPSVYKGLIMSSTDSDRIKMDYITAEVPNLADRIEKTDYDEAALVFFGMTLPLDKRLTTGETAFNDGTLRKDFSVVAANSSRESLRIHSRVLRLEDPPELEEFEPRVTYQTSLDGASVTLSNTTSS